MKFLKLKKGTDQMLSMYWFFILFIVSAGIVYMVGAFYSHPYDVRAIEANILVNKVADCVSYTGVLHSEIFEERFEENFLEECNINLEVEQEFDEEQYYFSVQIFEISDVSKDVFYMEQGNLNLVTSCDLDSEDYDTIARCVEKKLYSTQDASQYLVRILGVVDKHEKNVK